MTVRIGSLTITIERHRLGWYRMWARQSGNALRVVR
jgi:hypothetical protein